MRTAMVRAARALTPTVTRYWLAPRPGDEPLPPAEPGGHVRLRVGPRVKTFTVVATDDEGGYELAIRNRRIGDRYDPLSPRLHVGATVGVSAPAGRFAADAAACTRFLVAGVGVNPVLALLSQGRLRGWHLVYVDRGADEFPFLDRLRALAREQDGTVVTLDTAAGGRPDWAAVLAAVPAGAAVGVCGPPGMVAAVRAAAGETPGAPRIVTDGSGAGGTADLPSAVEIECVRTGVTFEAAQHAPLLDALHRNGVPVPSSCRQGICGTCEIEVRDGRVDHRDEVLTDEEKAASAYMLPCVSKSLDRRLVLDV